MKNQLKTMVLAVLLVASLASCKKKDGGGGGDSLGVPECDDYLAKMDACAKKLGDKGGEGITKMANMMRTSWKDEVKDAEKKSAMPSVCRGAIRDMKKQMPDCDWGAGSEPAAPAGSAAAAPEGSAAPVAAAAGDLPAECGEYKAAIEALSKCEKLPQATRDALKQSYEQTSAAWANVPAEGRAALGTACKSAADAVKQSAAACN